MERLWAPWRVTYVSTAAAPAGCVFCAALAAGDDRRVFILHRGKLAFLILNAFPYAPGHLMAAIVRHRGALEDATAEELTEAMQLVQAGIRALRDTYHPDGFNIGINQGRVAGAGAPRQLHVPGVPRWGRDASVMPVVADTKVLPETLEMTYDRLSAALRS